MNVRQSMLLNHLLYLDHYTPVEELARIIGCSEKTVRTDAKVVNEHLAHAGFASRIRSKRGNGIRMALARGEQSRLEAMVADNAIEMRPRLERFYRGILLITCSPKAFTVDSLAHSLFTNKQQLQMDMKWWSFMLKSFRLSIRKKDRLSIEGSEVAIRFFIEYFFYKLDRRMMQNRIEPTFMGQDARFLQTVADEAEQEMGLQLSKNSRQQTSFYLKVMCARLRLGRTLNESSEFKAAHPQLARKLKTRFERHLGMPVNDHEIALASNLFSCGTWQWSRRNIEEYEPAPRTIEAVERIERTFEQRFGQAPDHALRQRLLVLTDGALLRKSCNLSIPGPIEHVVKYDNMDGFLLLSEALHDAPELQDFNVFGADYTRIIMALLEYLDHVHTERVFRVGLVVNAGVEQAAYGKYRIEKLASKIRIVDVITENDVEQSPAESTALSSRFDFLISFEPLDSTFPTITVSEAIDEQDIMRIMTSIPMLNNDLETQLHCIEVDAVTQADDMRELAHEVHRELADRKILDMKNEQFARLFEASFFASGSTLVLPLFSSKVLSTCAVFFPVDNFNLIGALVKTVAVLLVSENDRSAVSSLTEQFKRILTERQVSQDALTAYFPA